MKPPVLIIFGITGDLSKRKLLPALYRIFSRNLLPPDTTIIGVSRREIDIDELLNSVELCVLEKDNICDPAGIHRLKTSLEALQLDPEQPEQFKALVERLDVLDDEVGTKRERLFYMAIPPRAYAPIVDQLGKSGLNDKRTRLLLEKPFGYDTASAQELISLVAAHYKEDQIYRIDHYLAKETAQNLLTFRMHNPIFSALWSTEHIDRVEIRAVEKITIEGRADFYEATGALRDLIQSHLLQLLAITLMDMPADMSSKEIHRTKQYFLEELLPASPDQAERAQYATYRDEVSNQSSTVETYAKVQLSHGSERWQGVPFILETGKALANKQTDITIHFRTNHAHSSNNLTFHIQPNEGITLDLIVQEPGLHDKLRHTALDFDYQKEFTDANYMDAYERVLMDAVRADQSLFSSDDEVLATWRVLQPVIDDWAASQNHLGRYEVGASTEEIAW